MDKKEEVKESVYLHVGNSGVTISVLDKHGPTVRVESSSFGNLIQRFEFMTTVEGLFEIRNVIDRALANHEFSEPYCCAAEKVEQGGCCVGSCEE